MAGSHLSSQAVAEDDLTGNLSGNCDGKSHERQLEAPADHIEVPNGEDEGDNRSVCNSGGT